MEIEGDSISSNPLKNEKIEVEAATIDIKYFSFLNIIKKKKIKKFLKVGYIMKKFMLFILVKRGVIL